MKTSLKWKREQSTTVESTEPPIVVNPVSDFNAGSKLPPLAAPPKIDNKLTGIVGTSVAISSSGLPKRSQKSVRLMANPKVYIDTDGGELDHMIALSTDVNTTAQEEKSLSPIVPMAETGEMKEKDYAKMSDKPISDQGHVPPSTTTGNGSDMK